MYDLMIYSLKVGVCLAVFYLFFKLLLSRETFHRFNRIVVLGAMFLSFVLPLCVITVYREIPVLPEIPDGEAVATAFAEPLSEPFPWEMLAGAAFLLGAAATLLWTLCSLIGVLRLIRGGRRERLEDGAVLVRTERSVTPFSWGRYIVMSERDLAENGGAILLHERAHLRLRHSLDLIVTDVAGCLQWFNPAMWLLRRELRAIHEYEADEAVLDSGVDARSYQMLLIKKAAGGRWYSIANSFNHSKLKKRITMMLKEKSNPWAKLKYLYILPVAAIAVTAFARPEISETAEEISAVKVNDLTAIVEAKAIKSTEESVQISTVSQDTVKVNYVPTEVSRKLQGTAVFEVVEEMPEFPGGVDAMMEYLQKELRYPESAKEKGIQGRVTVQFIIDKEGNVTNSKVTRSVDKDMDAEAIRLVKAMPKWKPGMQKGKAVAVKYTVPVVFRLEGGKTVNSQVTVNSKVSEFSVQGMNNPLYIVDGKEVTSSILSALDVNKIESMTVLKNESATEVYGEKGKNGVILITLKGSAEKSITLSNKSSVVNVPGLKGVYLNNRRAEWEDVDIFVDGEKIEMAGRALDEVVPPNRIESISVEKERNEAGRGKIYITTKAKEGVEKTSVRGDMKVEGFVQDKDGEPIVGATVLIEGTNMGTVTDVDGRFVMSASKEDKLVVSYIGMKGTKVKVASKVTITLKDE